MAKHSLQSFISLILIIDLRHKHQSSSPHHVWVVVVFINASPQLDISFTIYLFNVSRQLGSNNHNNTTFFSRSKKWQQFSWRNPRDFSVCIYPCSWSKDFSRQWLCLPYADQNRRKVFHLFSKSHLGQN